MFEEMMIDLYVRNEWVLTRYIKSDSFLGHVVYVVMCDLSTEKSIKALFLLQFSS